MSLLPNSTSLQVLYMGDKAEIVIEEMTSAIPAAEVKKMLEGAGWEMIDSGGFELLGKLAFPDLDRPNTFRIERWRKKV